MKHDTVHGVAQRFWHRLAHHFRVMPVDAISQGVAQGWEQERPIGAGKHRLRVEG